MKIKTKLTLGVGLLFGLIILLGVVGSRSVNDLKRDAENILVANYKTLQFTRNMLVALEKGATKGASDFESNLTLQEHNISEIGEKEVTMALRNAFEGYQLSSDANAAADIRKHIYTLMDMNMQAIQRKSQVAKETAERAVLWIAATATLCFVIAFVLLINLPANIANPIRELTDSIQQIAAKNYSERVHFEQHGEFGQLARSFNVMAKKLEEYNNSSLSKLMMEKKRIESLINRMHDPVIGLDEQMTFIFVNEEAVKIIGLPLAELINRPARELSQQNDLIRSLIDGLTENKADQYSTPLKIFADKKEGYFEKETLHITVTPTGETNEKLIGHVLILRNVTAYKELDSAKTNFIATISHEFKTPISSIKMSLQLLENEQIGLLNEDQKNLVDSINDDADRLLKITGELLNITQVESGKIQVVRSLVDPCRVLKRALEATRSQAEQKMIKFEVHCDDTLPEIELDPEKTTMVLTNLIANAVWYSYEHDAIVVSVKRVGNNVFFAIKDTGPGIAPEYLDKIFDRYFRIPGTPKEGTGLGLAISKEYIEAQGARISVESELGVGSTFTVDFPIFV